MVYNQGVPATYQSMPQNSYQVQPYQGMAQPQIPQVQPVPQMSNLQSFQQSPKKINVVRDTGRYVSRDDMVSRLEDMRSHSMDEQSRRMLDRWIDEADRR